MQLTLAEKRQGRRPIDFYFRTVADAKSDKVAFVDAFQVLNDIYLGRMNVVNYFFIAESSIRINELNLISLEELKDFKKFLKEAYFIPNICYNLPLTTRFLQNEKDFSILQDVLHDCGFKKGDLILTFNSSTLVKECDISEAKKRIERLRRMGYKICISGFGSEFNSLDIFALYNFNQLRVDAAYFDSSIPKKKLLQMLVRFCKANKIDLIVEGIDTAPQLKRFKASGVKFVTGKSVCKLNKWVTRDMLKLPTLTEEETLAWKLKIEMENKREERRAATAETKARMQAAKAMAELGSSGKLNIKTPPKPAGYKSPYEARLQQQRLLAKKAAQTKVDKQALNEKKLLAERKSEQEKAKLEALGGWGLKGIGGTTPMRTNNDESNQENLSLNSENQEIEFVEDNVKKTNTNCTETNSTDENNKNITKITAENGIEFEFEEVSPDEEEAEEKAKQDLEIKEDESEVSSVEQSKNQSEEAETQNTDEETQIFELDADIPQGSYNDQGQWVDLEGNVFNGYFDEEGRWIDYGFYGDDGEWLDNGYYSEKLQKWIPYGYFDENGNWVSLV